MTEVKLAEYVLERIARAGVRHVFLVPGGAAMHLNDALAGRQDVGFVANLHEHASAVGAESYAKVTGALGVALVTAGPGSTNCLTGLASAWVNSAPVLFISGQVNRAQMKGDRPLRQLGLQEVDTIAIVRPLTKYAATVTDPSSVREHLEMALFKAREGRPGPVWLEFPLDVQSAIVETDSLPPAVLPDVATQARRQRATTDAAVGEVLDRLRSADRPLLLLGAGIRIAGGADLALSAVEATGVPYATTWIGADLIGDDHPLFSGRPGSFASRAANFTIQNCDLLITIGARWDLATTGFSPRGLAREAYRVAVDVDAAELDKLSEVVDLGIECDGKDFLTRLISALPANWDSKRFMPWIEQIDAWRSRYSEVGGGFDQPAGTVSTYKFISALASRLVEDDVIVQGSAGNYSEIFCMTYPVKQGQRLISDGSLGAMGYGLPAAIGAALASGRRTVLVDGDGSVMPNIQELETIRRLQLPIKTMVISNGGYASIYVSQSRWFDRLIAADAQSGLTLPNLESVCGAFRIPYFRIGAYEDMEKVLDAALEVDGPALVEVVVSRDEDRRPRLTNYQRADGTMASKPLEDMFPLLSREEFLENMIIAPLEE